MEWVPPEFFLITYCPPGEAEHSHDLRRGGDPWKFEDLTVKPKGKFGGLIAGQGVPYWFIRGKHGGRIGLWHQELVVYLKEMHPYIRAQLLLEAIEEQAKKDKRLYGVDSVQEVEHEENKVKYQRVMKSREKREEKQLPKVKKVRKIVEIDNNELRRLDKALEELKKKLF